MEVFTIEEKLEFLGLDLDNIPEFLKENKDIRYAISSEYDDRDYKVYKHLNIDEIQIRVTTIDRLSSVNHKFEQSANLYDYIPNEVRDDKDLLRQTTFLNMLKEMSMEKIIEEQKNQEYLKKNKPFRVKYSDNFMWQIYYSKFNTQYFMLLPSKNFDTSKMFYLLKEQIEFHKNNRTGAPVQLYVPICGMDYTGQILKRDEISELESYLNLLTGNYPNIYEVFDENDIPSITIVGDAVIDGIVRTKYRMDLKNKDEAIEFYKLLKALFILKTEIKQEYNFNVKIDKNSRLIIYINKAEIAYKHLSEFLKQEYKLLEDNLNTDKIEINILKNKLENLKNIAFEKEREYFIKERQVSTYLEYKKTFFGKIKYYFKAKRLITDSVGVPAEHETTNEIDSKKISQAESYTNCLVNSNSVSNSYYYSLEDLINIDKIYRQTSKELKDTKLDIKSIELRIRMLDRKIENAKAFIEEIDKHKKSIFEFWKFSKKDDILLLEQGNGEQGRNTKIKRVFNFKSDINAVGEEFDTLQRKVLSKQEQGAIFVAKDLNLEDINKVRNKDFSDIQNSLDNIKSRQTEYENEKESLGQDIFGNIAYLHNKTKHLGNATHRESEKNSYNILGITNSMTQDEYVASLSNVINLLNSAFTKIQIKYDMTVYTVQVLHDNAFSICTLDPDATLQQISKLDTSNSDKIVLYKINLKENASILFYTNITMFDNTHETLPIGMNIGTDVLIDTSKFNIKLKRKEMISTNYYSCDDLNVAIPTVRDIYIEEYDFLHLT